MTGKASKKRHGWNDKIDGLVFIEQLNSSKASKT